MVIELPRIASARAPVARQLSALTFLSAMLCQACLSAPKPFVAEHFCSVCGTPFANAFPLDEEGRCAICRLGTRGFDAVYCFGGYEGVLRELVHLLKFGGVRTLAKPMGRYLSAVLPRGERFDAIVPMPLHWRRRWQRGFNQAELLSLELARRTGIPVRRLVRRTRPTAQQAGLSNARRRSNVTGAFAVLVLGIYWKKASSAGACLSSPPM